MSLFSELVIFGISLFLLSKGSNTVIKSSVKIARITKLGELTIGFLLLSVTTSLPELAVSMNAIASNDVGISIGNILGSNIANICLVIGLMGFLQPVRISEKTLMRLSEILSLSSFVLIILLVLNPLSKLIGLVLLFFFGVFVMYSLKKKITLEIKIEEKLEFLTKFRFPPKFYFSLIFLIVGLLVVIFSSSFVVSSASNIALMMGIPESVIGATIIAIGTSLPEISTVLAAFKDRHLKLGLGNAIGSCLTNLTLILGIVLVYSPFRINMEVFTTLVVFFLISNTVFWFFVGSIGRKKLDRMEGAILIGIYIIFLIATFSYTVPDVGNFYLVLNPLK
jgi:cation:H+ antiporter